MKKQLTIMAVIVAAVLGLGVFLFMSQPEPIVQTQPSNDIKGEKMITRPESHSLGNKDAKVTLTEFGDYQCPACAAAHAPVKQLAEQYKDNPNFRFVFRNFPLTDIHPNALASSEAAEAAALQDKFWEMHDLLYERQNDWSTSLNPMDKFTSYATELGLDVEKFKADMLSQQVVDKVTQDLQDAIALGANSTPTFYLNDQLIKGLDPELPNLISKALAQ
jgi:protein-disulfide isomerase